MFPQRIFRIGTFGLALWIVAGLGSVHAQQNKAEVSVAVVDMDRLFQGSDAPKQLAQKTAEIEAAATQKFQDIALGGLLDQKEGQEYVSLLTKPTLTAEEQARLKQMRELSDTRGKRLQELSQRTPLADAEKNELRDLAARQRQMAQILPRIQNGLQAEISARIENVRRELLTQLKAKVMEVAKASGVTQVYPSDVLIYATNDLTAQVLQKLNGGGAQTPRPGQNKTEAASVAVVDMNQVFESSEAPKQLAQKAADIEAEASRKFQDITSGAFLDQKEGQEYLQLLTKAKPTPEDQTRLKQLRELSTTRDKRLQELSQKNPLNDAEKNEMRDLDARRRNMDLILPRFQEDLQADAAARIEAVRRELYSQIREVVAKVAKDKGVTQVFSSEALIYASQDLTPQVLQKFKK
jgi:Skp family chaperone for outer membrane proteins